jgi:DeoR/GlpR family transcriptional regulator of sugar metabolism
MLADARMEYIKNRLKEQSFLELNDICTSLNISVATARRDLNRLEQEGYITRRHGGAVINHDYNKPAQSSIRQGDNDPLLAQKEIVGKHAAKLIENGDVIFIGAGNTCWLTSINIDPNLSLTVITSCFDTAIELGRWPNVHVIFCGGDVAVEHDKLFTVGQYVLQTLKEMYINKCFFTVNGITLEQGYSIDNHYLTEIFRYLMENSDEVIVVADHSKFGKRAFRLLCPFDAIRTVVTDTEPHSSFVEHCQIHGIRLIVPDEESECGICDNKA